MVKIVEEKKKREQEKVKDSKKISEGEEKRKRNE